MYLHWTLFFSGYGRCLVYKNAKSSFKTYSDEKSVREDVIDGITRESHTGNPVWKHQILDPADGCPHVGLPVETIQETKEVRHQVTWFTLTFRSSS